MNARLPVLLLLLTALAGCGTRSIIVPVTRPAAIDVHRCSRVLIASIDTSMARVTSMAPVLPGHSVDSFTAGGIAKDLNTALPAALTNTGQAEWVAGPAVSGRGLFRTTGKISGEFVQQLRREYGVSCVLAVTLREARYDESMLSATIQSTVTPGSEKRVRQARASLVIDILLIDAIEGRVAFADSMRSDLSRETRASDQEPPEMDIADMQWMLVNQAAMRIAEATQPLPDREIVTFLLDDDVPAIEHAIGMAELGRWPSAVAVLDSVAAEAGEREGSDVIWYNLGLARQYAGNFSAAMKAFETALRIKESGRYRAAIERLLQAEEEYLERANQGL